MQADFAEHQQAHDLADARSVRPSRYPKPGGSRRDRGGSLLVGHREFHASNTRTCTRIIIGSWTSGMQLMPLSLNP
jgi:hypothetical protein